MPLYVRGTTLIIFARLLTLPNLMTSMSYRFKWIRRGFRRLYFQIGDLFAVEVFSVIKLLVGISRLLCYIGLPGLSNAGSKSSPMELDDQSQQKSFMRLYFCIYVDRRITSLNFFLPSRHVIGKFVARFI